MGRGAISTQRGGALSVGILILGIFLGALEGTESLQTPKKSFFTIAMLVNKVYQEPYFTAKITSTWDCRTLCQRVKGCFAFAASIFERQCHIYKYAPGLFLMTNYGYRLYISERSEADGFYKTNDGYAKLYVNPMSYFDAQKTCNSLMGDLFGIKSNTENDLLAKLMNDRKIFAAYIGLTDAAEEGTWLYSDGTPVRYANWHYKGVWHRTDKNCAMIRADAKWYHIGCYDKLPFFCRIPYF